MSWVIYHESAKQRVVSRKLELKLAEAVASNNVRAVRKLLSRGVDPNLEIVGQNQDRLNIIKKELLI